MNKRSLIIFGFLFILLNLFFISAQSQCAVYTEQEDYHNCVLVKGDSLETPDGSYIFQTEYFSSDQINLVVNGKKFDNVLTGGEYTLSDGNTIKIGEISYSNYGDSFVYFLIGARDVPESQCVVYEEQEGYYNCVLVKGDSLETPDGSYIFQTEYFSSDQINLVVNGKKFDNVLTGGEYTLSDGNTIKIGEISYSNYGDSFVYFLIGARDVPESQCVVYEEQEGYYNCVLVKGDSLETPDGSYIFQTEYFSSDQINLVVNGKKFDNVLTGGEYTLSDGNTIKIGEISYSNYGDSFVYFLIGARDVPESTKIDCPSGCILKNKCVPIGYRTFDSYCDISGSLLEYELEAEVCYNNFECKGNLCIDDECIQSGFFKKIIEWFKRIF